jgi:hypothetical protein
MLIIAGMHVLGLACAAVLLLPALRSGSDLPPRGKHDSDEGGGHGPTRPPNPFDLPTGGLPLPDAVQSRVRLRDHRRLPDFVPRPDRRPAREPGREPVRASSQ